MATIVSADPKTRDAKLTRNECQYTVVDVADNSTTVFTGPCILYGLIITTILSAHVLEVKDGTTVIAAFVATAPVGSNQQYAGIRCDTSLVVDPNDAATGRVTVIWRKVNPD